MSTDRRIAWSWLHGLALIGGMVLIAAQLGALVAHRVDYPLVDDWRYYTPPTQLPDRFSPGWLLAPAEDTVHVTGKGIDWLLLRRVSHDYRVLAGVSFVLSLGGWLLATGALCWRMGRGREVALLAVLVSFAVPLAASPYFVTTSPHQYLEPAIAYHQMLPMLGLSLLGLLVFAPPKAWPRALRGAVAFWITLLFSLVYSSGAVVMLSFGVAVSLLSYVERRGSPDVSTARLELGLATTATAALALLAHVLLPMQRFGINPATQARSHGMTLPFEAEFWSFLFGLYDRAFLSTDVGAWADLRGAVGLLAMTLPIFGLCLLLLRGRLAARERAVAIVVSGTLASVLGYAAIVTYGRASFGDFYFQRLYDPLAQARLYAHSRFFYWWLSACLPIALVGWGLWVEKVASRRAAAGVVVGLLLLAVVPKPQHSDQEWGFGRSWDYVAAYERDAVEVRALLEVERDRMAGGNALTSRRIAWSRLVPGERNPRYRRFEGRKRTWRVREEAWRRAGEMGASFVRGDEE